VRAAIIAGATTATMGDGGDGLLGGVATHVKAAIVTAGALAVSTVAGGGGAASGDGEGVSPHGNFVNMLDNGEPRSRPELMQAALQSLEQSRVAQTSSPRLVPGKDDRTAWANDTWLKLYAILDYNHDHVLHVHEVIKGIQMVKHAWKMCAEKLWPVSLLDQTQRLRFKHGMIERMCPRLDDVQALALALADGDQLSWVKSTNFIQVRTSSTDRILKALTNVCM
jgi:hypothetical protein